MDYPFSGTGTDRRLLVNKIVAGRQTIEELDVTETDTVSSSDLIFSYPGAEQECITWLNALEGKGDLVVYPQQAYVVTQILEAIYESARTGNMVKL